VTLEREKDVEQRFFGEKLQVSLLSIPSSESVAENTSQMDATLPSVIKSVRTNENLIVTMQNSRIHDVHVSTVTQTSDLSLDPSLDASSESGTINTSHTDPTRSAATKLLTNETMQNSRLHGVSAKTSVTSLDPSSESSAVSTSHMDPTLSSVTKSVLTDGTIQNNRLHSASSIAPQWSVTLATQKSSYEQPPCKLSNCVDLLTLSEQILLKNCEKKAVQYTGHQLPHSTCRFMRGGISQCPVALNSQEGSGNSWLRGLLEKATGICTGFNGCDVEMRARGFLGESIQSAHVLVVKTHVHIPKWIGEKSIARFSYESSYGSAIFLIRNPAHGMIAEWNRKVTIKKIKSSNSSHTNVISQNEFGMWSNIILLAMLYTKIIYLHARIVVFWSMYYTHI
jgi:hypothetical protein